ncbi:MAG TPA: glycosyltransferase [Nitrososphaerales archaeon]|nr:glycosyltransferase [Nitrososphaerales archaeon]
MSSDLPPKISFVIPTYNREKKLNRLLESIAISEIKSKYEVIVVDDSECETPIDGHIHSSLGDRLRLIRNVRRRFISSAKNIGWKNAQGKYVFFVDDDNVLPEGTVDTLSETLDANTKIGALMPVVYYEKKRDLVWVYSAPFVKGRWKFNLIGRNELEKEKPGIQFLPTDALPNASMVRRGILEATGGFDESLPVNSSCDLCQKIKRLGYQAYALGSASIYHDVTLPGTPGYWAEHASEDYARRYYEVRDWFDLMSRLHHGEPFLPLKEFARSFLFLVPVSSGILMHPTRRKQSLRLIYLSMLRGLVDGVKISAGRHVPGH